MKVLYKELISIDGVEYIIFKRDLSDLVDDAIKSGTAADDHIAICNIVVDRVVNDL
jgi:hypothetical protein